MSKRVLAVASGGGHWQQLMMLSPAFAHCDIRYVTTLKGLGSELDGPPPVIVPDCNRNEPLRALACIFVSFWVVLRLRPHLVISTGAMPGLVALAIGRMIGARTIWVDSIANAERLSISGRVAKRIVHSCLSQWPAVAEAENVDYAGAIL